MGSVASPGRSRPGTPTALDKIRKAVGVIVVHLRAEEETILRVRFWPEAGVGVLVPARPEFE